MANKLWATCPDCKQEMKPGSTCKFTHYKVGSKSYKRIPNIKSDICPDCNVGLGKYHHPGCDIEVCPVCNGQAMGCDCLLTDEQIEEINEQLKDWVDAHVK